MREKEGPGRRDRLDHWKPESGRLQVTTLLNSSTQQILRFPHYYTHTVIPTSQPQRPESESNPFGSGSSPLLGGVLL